MVEMGARVSDLEGRLDSQAREMAGIREGLKRLEDKVDSRFRHMETRFEQIDNRFLQIDNRFLQIDNRFQQMDARFQQVDNRFQQIDNRFQQIDNRFLPIDNRFESLEGRMAQGFQDVRSEMHSNFRWIMGGIGAALLTIVLSMMTQVYMR